MLWALISSAFIIYLYRKLKSEQEPQTANADGGNGIDAELDKLSEQIRALEARLASVEGREAAR